jgi:hypothetical protein
MALQQGLLSLVTGEVSYEVSYPSAFTAPPQLIHTDVYNAAEAESQLWLEAVVTSRSETGFTVDLITPPDTDDYVLSWLAGSEDAEIVTEGPDRGIPFSSLPPFKGNSLPANSRLPIVIPSARESTFTVRWDKLQSLMGNAHNHTVSQLSDATATGRLIMTAASGGSVLTIIGGAPSSHTHTASEISDSTAIGRAVLGASSQLNARAAIAAAAASHVHVLTDITDTTSLGRSIAGAASASVVRDLIDAANEVHTHVINDITDTSALGKTLMAVASAADARTAIDALSSQGSMDLVVVNTGSFNLINSSGTKKYIVNSVSSAVNINPANYTNTHSKISVFVGTGYTFTVNVTSPATLVSDSGNSLGASVILPAGTYDIDQYDTTWVVSSYKGSFGSTLLATTSASAAKSALGITAVDISDSSSTGRAVLTGADATAIRTTLGVPSTVHTHTISQISNAGVTGASLLATVDAASARATISAAAASHTHSLSDITSGFSTLGLNLATATTATSARSYLDAASTSHTHAIASITGVDIYFSGTLASLANAAAWRTALDVPSTSHTHTITVEDIVDVEPFMEDFLVALNDNDARIFLDAADRTHTHVMADITDLETLPYDIVGLASSASLDISTYSGGNPAGKVYIGIYNSGGHTLTIDSLGTMQVGQHFIVRNSSTQTMTVTGSGTCRVNNGSNVSISTLTSARLIYIGFSGGFDQFVS